jgi:hypothetical protein
MHERMDVWMYGCMGVWMYGCMDVWMDAWMDACMHVCGGWELRVFENLAIIKYGV